MSDRNDDRPIPTRPRGRYRLPRFRRSRVDEPYPEDIIPPDFLGVEARPGEEPIGSDGLTARQRAQEAYGDRPREGDYVPSPEDFEPSPPKPKSPLTRFPSARHARPAVLCYVLFFVASIHTWREAREHGLWVSGASVFERGEWWRLFTALFTHSDLGHIAANTPLFLIFGWYLRAYFGPAAFPLTALVVGALSNLATVWTYDPRTHLVGASGMLYGMVALWLVLYVRFETTLTVPMRIFRSIAVSLLLLFPTTFQEETSYAAHGFGFLIGIALGLPLTLFVRINDKP